MKKYKHKHTNVVAIHESVGKYIVEDWGILSPVNNSVTLNFDFNSNDWEEVKEEPFIQQSGRVDRIKEEKLWGVSVMKEEPNYLITAFRLTKVTEENGIVTLGSDGKYGYWFTLKDMLSSPPCVEDGSFEIYSVKNSKGEEFTIGDKASYVSPDFINNKADAFKIHNFFINRDGILLARSSKESSATCEDINTIIKVKKPLYTTTDGLNIYEGDGIWLWLLSKDLNQVRGSSHIYAFGNKDKEVADRYLTFTSEENRDKYIKENTKKPVFVSADGVEFYKGQENYLLFSIDRETFEHKSMLIQTCIDYNTYMEENIHFSTVDARQEYIDNNKPKYSLADIEKAYSNTQSPTTSPLFQNFKSELKKLGK